MLTTYHSNRLETLAERLARLIETPVGPALAPEVVLVQNSGMARWLSLRLAEHLGVCTNVRFPFPAAFLWQLFRTVLRAVPDTSPFETPVLTWRILALLEGIVADARFARVRAYLREDDDFRRYDLATRIADAFDQYLVYRPDWVLGWETGEEVLDDEDARWQAALWQKHAGTEPAAHRARLQQRFFEVLERAPEAARLLPTRVVLFGIPSLPPAYTDAFVRLAQHTEVHLFLLNPCHQYWGEIRPERDIVRIARERDAAALYLETGNPLLASFGQVGRDHIDLLQGAPQEEVSDFQAPARPCLLHHLQGDILDLLDRGRGEVPVIELAPDDRSLQVHVCHSPMREVEVLYDQLLALFDADPALSPSDIVVMAPDIERYAPYIEAVLGVAEGEARLPYHIADRGLRSESMLIETFFALLDLPGSRWDAASLLAILECPAVMHRFGLGEEDLDLVRGWIREAGIRWGRDAASRRELGLPDFPEHTWQSGRDRLLLGYALPGAESRLFAGLLPYDDVEGSTAQVMGRLQAFAEALCVLEGALRGTRTLADWAERLHAALERLFDPDEEEAAYAQALRDALAALAESAAQAGFSGAVSAAVAKSALRRALDGAERTEHFLSGGITFAGMVPMRSVPFEVVCLLGLNDGRFPRAQRAIGFDLIARHPRRGDRSRAHEDRYLFLEALLSARRCLYLSYVGQGLRDNGVIPPSVLLAELLGYLRQGFVGPSGREVLPGIVVRHPLQAFSRRYFNGTGPLFSYSDELCEASRHAGRGTNEAHPLCGAKLPAPRIESHTVRIEDLVRFFAHPSRYLIQQRLGIYLDEAEARVEAHEPFTLDLIQRRNLRDRLLKAQLEGAAPEAFLPIARAAGWLPHGAVGSTLLARETEVVAGFLERLRPLLPAAPIEPLSVDLTVGAFRLTGSLAGLTPAGRLGYRVDEVRPSYRVKHWIWHLVLNRVAPGGIAPVSYWLGEDETLTLQPVADPETALAQLLEWYWEGLQGPLHFFVKSAHAYAAAVHKNGKEPLERARRTWLGSRDHPGEGSDHFYALAFRGTDPLDSDFERLAAGVLLPLLQHCVEG